jgi:Glycosyltransferase family 87
VGRAAKRERASRGRDSESPARGRQSFVVTLIGAVLVLIGLAYGWQQASSTDGLDFYQFWVGGRIAPQEQNLYTLEVRHRAGAEYLRRAGESGSERMMRAAESRKDLELFSTPFLYTCFAALPASYDRAYLTYTAISLAALAGAMLLVGRAIGWSHAPILFAAAFVLFVFQPLKSELRVGNVNNLQLLLLGAAMFMGRRNAFASGVIVAIAVAFKPNIVVIVPLMIVARMASEERRELLREIAGMIAGSVAAVVVSSLYFRSIHAWTNWLAAARNLWQGIFARSDGNVAPVLAIVQSFGSAAAYAVALILLAIAGFAIWRGKGSVIAAVAIGPVIYLLTAPLVWFHYLMLAIPLALWTMRSRSLPLQVAGGIALTLIAADPWEAFLPIRTYNGEAILVAIGLVTIFVFAVAPLLRREERIAAGA